MEVAILILPKDTPSVNVLENGARHGFDTDTRIVYYPLKKVEDKAGYDVLKQAR